VGGAGAASSTAASGGAASGAASGFAAAGAAALPVAVAVLAKMAMDNTTAKEGQQMSSFYQSVDWSDAALVDSPYKDENGQPIKGFRYVDPWKGREFWIPERYQYPAQNNIMGGNRVMTIGPGGKEGQLRLNTGDWQSPENLRTEEINMLGTRAGENSSTELNDVLRTSGAKDIPQLIEMMRTGAIDPRIIEQAGIRLGGNNGSVQLRDTTFTPSSLQDRRGQQTGQGR